MGCCRDFASVYMKLINFLVMVFAVVILGFSIFLAGRLGDELTEIELNGPIVASVVLGSAMFIFSLIGLCGTYSDNKIMILLYIFGTAAVAIGVLSSGAVLLTYRDSLDNVELRKANNREEQIIVDFSLAAFKDCCDAEDSEITFCADDDNFPCVHDEERFDDFLEAINDDTCDALEKFESGGSPLVGDRDDGSCGGGAGAKEFVNDMARVLRANLEYLAVANLVIGCLLLLLLLAACVLLCTRPDDDYK